MRGIRAVHPLATDSRICASSSFEAAYRRGASAAGTHTRAAAAGLSGSPLTSHAHIGHGGVGGWVQVLLLPRCTPHRPERVRRCRNQERGRRQGRQQARPLRGCPPHVHHKRPQRPLRPRRL